MSSHESTAAAAPAEDRLVQIVRRLALAFAVSVTIALPGGYFGLNYSNLIEHLETVAQVKAGAINVLVSANPDMWTYELQRIEELLLRYPLSLSGDRASVYDAVGNLLLVVGKLPDAPVLVRSSLFYDSGLVVGQVEIAHSYRAVVFGTLVAGLLGLLLGVMAYASVFVLPLRALRRVSAALAQETAAAAAIASRYRAVMQASTDGYWELDAAGRILEVNDRYLQLSGYTREELLRMTIFDIAAKENREGIKANLEKTRIAGSRTIEVSHRSKDGRIWTVENSTVYLPLDGGRYHSFLRDITERKRVEEELKRYAQTLAAVMSQLTMAEEQERRAIAADLHDDLTQLLAAANIKMRSLPDPDDTENHGKAIREATEVVAQAERSARSLSFQISPPLLFELGLVPALEGLAEELRKVYGLTAIIHDDGKPKDLAPTARSVLYRATRELLINVAKHAKVDVANVDVRNDDGLLVIAVTDSGVGFDKRLTEKHSPKAGFGLASMRERLRLIGGNFDIDTHPGDGTLATLTVPLAEVADR